MKYYAKYLYSLILPAAALLIISCSGTQEKELNAGGMESPGENITVRQLYNIVRSGEDIYLLDVRTAREYHSGRLAFSDQQISYDRLTYYADRLPQDKDSDIFVFCRTGRRSAIALNILKDMGYTNVHNVLGGIHAWQSAGYDITSGPAGTLR